MTNEKQKAQTVSYCRNITKKKLMSLWLAALLLFLGASACVYGWIQFGADRSGWDYMDYIKLVIGWGGAVFFFASGIGTAYTAVPTVWVRFILTGKVWSGIMPRLSS